MVYCIDLDNTLCNTIGTDYRNSTPIWSRIGKVNELANQGHTIVIQTGRHWNNLELTEKQLTLWGIRYKSLVMGNIPADFYVNDKSVSCTDFFEE